MKLRGLSAEQERALAERAPRAAGAGSAAAPFKLITTLRYDPRLPSLTRHIPIALSDSFAGRFFLSHLHYQKLRYGAKLLGWNVALDYDAVTQVLEGVERELIAEADAAAAAAEAAPPAIASAAAPAGTGAGTGAVPPSPRPASSPARAAPGPHRVRLTLDAEGHLTAEHFPAELRKNLFSGLLDEKSDDAPWDVVLDTQRLPADFSPAYDAALKTTNRAVYDAARARNAVQGHREVLLVSHDGLVTEGSISSVAFWRDGGWVTPPLAAGGMVSALRSFFLELAFMREAQVPVDSVEPGERVLLFNGVVGIVRGTIAGAPAGAGAAAA